MLFPLVPWLMAGSVEDRFSGRATLKSVANLAALFAIAAWAANLVLASRIRPVERALGGLEHLYRLHRRVGVLVVVLAATHALFLTLHAGGSALDLYLPAAGWGTFSGVIAFVLLIGFVVTSLVGRLSYQTFVLVQRLLGVGLYSRRVPYLRGARHRGFLTCLDHLPGMSDGAGCREPGLPVDRRRLGIGRHRYRVDEVRQLDDDVVEIVMVPVGRPFAFQAGQFVYATFHQSGIPRESHPFTIASAPGDDPLRLAVKRFGDFTSSMMKLRPGSQSQLEGPFGGFHLRSDPAHPQTWIAGGIGITPFLSWARSLDSSIPSGSLLLHARAGTGSLP